MKIGYMLSTKIFTYLQKKNGLSFHPTRSTTSKPTSSPINNLPKKGISVKDFR